MTDLAASFPDLTFDRPAPRVLRITLDGPGLNSVNHAVHRQLADVWRAVDEDDETNAVVLRGAGKAKQNHEERPVKGKIRTSQILRGDSSCKYRPQCLP